ncbi:uncharacterized protein [Drosophila kikkawai]|uniref:DUF4780 domain-containing protein n=1 Tax=Drosophila kikkawai TaxID=30033 RepID=A0ABM4GQ88_DROKI
MNTTKQSASDLVGEVKPHHKSTESELDEEELLRSDDETLAPSNTEGGVKTSTPQTTQPKHTKAAASQAKATGEHGKTKPWTHQQRKAQASKAHFILAEIARNEKEGKADPRDAADKARFLAVIEEYERYEKEHPETSLPPQAKRNRSQEVARDSLAMALIDELNDDGRLLMEKWEEVETQLAEMVTDKLLSEPTGQSPSFDSSDMVRGHRVIRCDDEFSRDFLADCVASLSKAWKGISIKLVPAKDIPRRPRARIWLPKGLSSHERVLKTLRAMNKGVDMEDWAILRAEREMKSSQPYLFLINQRCLEQLKAADNKVRYGIRKAKVKVFLDEPDDILEDEVEDANKLLDDLAIDDSTPNTTPI